MSYTSTTIALQSLGELEHKLWVLNQISDEDFSEDLKKLEEI